MMGDKDGGIIFVGTEGKLMTGTYGMNPTLLPKHKMDDLVKPAPWIPRIPGGDGDIWNTNAHEQDWIRACKEDPGNPVESSSHFGLSGPFNEMDVMGVLAVGLQDLHRTLKGDGGNMEITNISQNDRINFF